MRLLVDTHCWLWMSVAPERIARNALRYLTKDQNELLLSAASVWEIVIKYSLGKLTLPVAPSELVPQLMTDTRTYPLAIQHNHAFRVGQLPLHHKDPFDRLLIAQAQVESIPIVSHDPIFRRYNVKVISA